MAIFLFGAGLLGLLFLVAVAVVTVGAALAEGEETLRAGADKGGGGLREELGGVAVFLSADKVAWATNAIELVEELEALGMGLKDEGVRKRSQEEAEALRREVEGFFKEARRSGEEARMAGLWLRAESARSWLSSSLRLEGGPPEKGRAEATALS